MEKSKEYIYTLRVELSDGRNLLSTGSDLASVFTSALVLFVEDLAEPLTGQQKQSFFVAYGLFRSRICYGSLAKQPLYRSKSGIRFNVTFAVETLNPDQI